VVQVPEKDPAKKALTTGLASKSILKSLLRFETLRLKFVKVNGLFLSIRELITESGMVEENQKVFGHEKLTKDGLGLDAGDEAGLERDAGFGLKKSYIHLRLRQLENER